MSYWAGLLAEEGQAQVAAGWRRCSRLPTGCSRASPDLRGFRDCRRRKTAKLKKRRNELTRAQGLEKMSLKKLVTVC
jgi:hypothetical protein